MQQPSHDLKMFRTSPVSPRRFISIGVVGALHVLAIWALATGLAARLLEKPLEELKAEVVQQKPPDNPKEPPPPPPDLAKPPPPFVPPPDISIQQEAPSTNAISQVQTQQTTKPAISAPASIGRPHACGRDKYPPLAVRLNHEGITTLSFHIGTDGSVKDITVAKSSGFDELDQAAISCASSWRYKPAVQNDQPIEVPWQTNVKWALNGH